MPAAILAGERCRLRPYAVGDIDAAAREANDVRVSRYMSARFPHPYTRRDAEAWIAGALDSATDWAIEIDGRYAGGIGLHPEVVAGVRELGYWLAVRAWGRGVASEAVALLCTHAFEALAIRRLQAFVFADNAASARVLEKNRFTFEGRFRDYYLGRDGSLCDALLFARLARD